MDAHCPVTGRCLSVPDARGMRAFRHKNTNVQPRTEAWCATKMPFFRPITVLLTCPPDRVLGAIFHNTPLSFLRVTTYARRHIFCRQR